MGTELPIPFIEGSLHVTQDILLSNFPVSAAKIRRGLANSFSNFLDFMNSKNLLVAQGYVLRA